MAIVANFLPLLFMTFYKGYNIPLEKVTLLTTVNFFVQLITDVSCAKLIVKIGHRAGIILANAIALIGLVLLAFLPDVMDPFCALIIGVTFCAVGGGLEEVLISPIVEACPTKNKAGVMSLVHSFYCWGAVIVISLSTLFFVTVGVGSWKILSLLWAIVPVINVALFCFVPVYNQKETVGKENGIKSLFKTKIFWLFAVLMVCSGAAEQAMAQWSSAFAESALGVNKTVGDMLGACLFVLCMAFSRTLYGIMSTKIKLEKFMVFSAILCAVSYALTVFSPFAWLSLISCGLIGFASGIMWPGTVSTATKTLPKGGTAMFAFLALFGDVGCTLGPTVVGFASGIMGDDLKKGLALAIIFPLILIFGVIFVWKKNKKTALNNAMIDNEQTQKLS